MSVFSVRQIDTYFRGSALTREVAARNLDEAYDIAQDYLATDGYADRVEIFTDGRVTHAYDKADPVPSPVPPVVYRNERGDTVEISVSGSDRGGWDLRIVRRLASTIAASGFRTTSDRTDWFETTAVLRARRDSEARVARAWGYRLDRQAVAA